jgi:hypothetical protein
MVEAKTADWLYPAPSKGKLHIKEQEANLCKESSVPEKIGYIITIQISHD